MNRRRLIVLTVALLLLLPAVVRAQLAIVGHYTGGDTTLDVATYASDKGKTTLLGISRKVSFAFSKAEMKNFIALWHKARATHANSFQFVGSMKETDTSYNSLLTVAAGPGVQFTVNDKPGTFIFVLAPKDYVRFDLDLGKALAFYDAQ